MCGSTGGFASQSHQVTGGLCVWFRVSKLETNSWIQGGTRDVSNPMRFFVKRIARLKTLILIYGPGFTFGIQ